MYGDKDGLWMRMTQTSKCFLLLVSDLSMFVSNCSAWRSWKENIFIPENCSLSAIWLYSHFHVTFFCQNPHIFVGFLRSFRLRLCIFLEPTTNFIIMFYYLLSMQLKLTVNRRHHTDNQRISLILFPIGNRRMMSVLLCACKIGGSLKFYAKINIVALANENYLRFFFSCCVRRRCWCGNMHLSISSTLCVTFN